MHLVSPGVALGMWVLLGWERDAGPRLGPDVYSLAPGGGTQTTGTCLHRRTGKVGLSGMAIADITLLSGFHALRADLEKV